MIPDIVVYSIVGVAVVCVCWYGDIGVNYVGVRVSIVVGVVADVMVWLYWRGWCCVCVMLLLYLLLLISRRLCVRVYVVCNVYDCGRVIGVVVRVHGVTVVGVCWC